MNRARWITLFAFVVVMGAGAWAGTRLRVTSGMGKFLPGADNRVLSDLSAGLADSDLARSWIVAIHGKTLDDAASAAKGMAATLASHPKVASARMGVSSGDQEALYEAYFPKRVGFLSDNAADLKARLSDAGLLAAAQALRSDLGSAMGTFARRIATADPLMLFTGLTKRMREAESGGLTLRDDVLVGKDGRTTFVFMTTRSSPFDAKASRDIEASVRSAYAKASAASPLTGMEQSALHRYAVVAERTIRRDITRVSIGSTILMVAVFLLLFRSVRYLALAFAPTFAGLSVATVVTYFLFGEVHGMSLAFGAAIMGVCADYAEHLLVHHAMDPTDATRSVRRVRGGIVVGSITTIAGLAGMAWASFPGMRELAVFAAVGVTASVGFTFWLLPPWLPTGDAAGPCVAFGRWFAESLPRWPLGKLRWLCAVPLLLLLGLPRLQWTDSLMALNERDPAMVREDDAVRAQVSRFDGGRLVAVFAKEEATALERNDAMAASLAAGVSKGELAGFGSVHSWLWSPKLQGQSRDAMAKDASFHDRFERAFGAAGFNAGSFEPFFEAVRQPYAPLTFAALARTPLRDVVTRFRVEADGQVGWVTLLRGVADPVALRARVSQLGATYFDQSEFLTLAYGAFRERVLWLFGVGMFVVLAVLFGRYRAWRPTMAAFTPAVLASLSVLGLVGLTGQSANLMHVLGMLLVVSMGEDYSVFITEHRHDAEDMPATVLGVLLACFTTVVSFGFLGFSSHPALRALGTTVGVGVLLALVYSPLGAWVFRDAKAPHKEAV